MAGETPATAPTDVEPRDFLDGLDPRRRDEGLVLLDLMEEATGDRAVMWGASMIGLGTFRDPSRSGSSQGDWFRVGFSPRKARLTFYGLQGHPRSEELLGKVGRHTLGAGCVYATRLEHLDLDVLRELVADAYGDVTGVGVTGD